MWSVTIVGALSFSLGLDSAGAGRGEARRLRASVPRCAIPLWRSAASTALAGDARTALGVTLENLGWPSDEDSPPPDFCLLTVPQEHSDKLQLLSAEAARATSANLLIGVLGMAIGDGKEFDREPGFSLLAGCWPANTQAKPFVVSADRFPSWSQLVDDEPTTTKPSFLLFADPFSAVQQVTAILNDRCPGSVVAGGLSCPTTESTPSLALYMRGAQCRALPAGSMIGLRLQGENFELHTATAQGAAPVGPSFVVTKGGGPDGNLVSELDGAPALQRLSEVAQAAGSAEPRLLRLIQRALLCGMSVEADDDDGDGGAEEGVAAAPDLLIRQVLGANNDGGLFLGDRVRSRFTSAHEQLFAIGLHQAAPCSLNPHSVAAHVDPLSPEQVRVGSTRVQFHVRDEQAAHDELDLLLGRYRVERQFSGRFERARPLGCVRARLEQWTWPALTPTLGR